MLAYKRTLGPVSTAAAIAQNAAISASEIPISPA
jgi:hypothetical protein